jgi:hypothetical protein
MIRVTVVSGLINLNHKSIPRFLVTVLTITTSSLAQPSLSWSLPAEVAYSRTNHSVAVIDDVFFVFGGFVGYHDSVCNELWSVDTKTIRLYANGQQLLPGSFTGSSPEARQEHAMTAVGKTLFVFGGCREHPRAPPANSMLSDLWTLDTGKDILSWEQLQCSIAPTARAGHGMVAVGSELLMFGGRAQTFPTIILADRQVHSVNTSSSCPAWITREVLGTPPASRFGHGMAALGGTIFVFGGHDGRLLLNDLHALQADAFKPSWRWSTLSAPNPPSQRMQFGFAGVGGALWVFGGDDGQRDLNGLHRLDISAYSDAPVWAAAPPPWEEVIPARACLNYWAESCPAHIPTGRAGIQNGMAAIRATLVVYGGAAAIYESYSDLRHVTCGLGAYGGPWTVNCSACGAGTFSSSVGATSCSPCSSTCGAGEALCPAGAATNSCAPCPAGTYQPDPASSSTCRTCNATCGPGEYLCPAGSHSDTCGACAAGKYQPHSASSATGCLPCQSPCAASQFLASCSGVSGEATCASLGWARVVPQRDGSLAAVRYYHVKAAVNNAVYLFLGHLCSSCNSVFGILGGAFYSFDLLWRMDTGSAQPSWKELAIPGESPSTRSGQSMCSVGLLIYVFGGDSDNDRSVPEPRNRLKNDLWALDTLTVVWKQLNCSGAPPARTGQGMVAVGASLWVFGGRHFPLDERSSWQWWATFDGNVYALDTTSASLSWLSWAPAGTPPPPRFGHGMAAAGSVVYVFSGSDGRRNLDDLHSLQTDGCPPRWAQLTAVRIPQVPLASPIGFAATAQALWVLQDTGLLRNFAGPGALDSWTGVEADTRAGSPPSWLFDGTTGPNSNPATALRGTVVVCGREDGAFDDVWYLTCGPGSYGDNSEPTVNCSACAAGTYSPRLGASSSSTCSPCKSTCTAG